MNDWHVHTATPPKCSKADLCSGEMLPSLEMGQGSPAELLSNKVSTEEILSTTDQLAVAWHQ